MQIEMLFAFSAEFGNGLIVRVILSVTLVVVIVDVTVIVKTTFPFVMSPALGM